MTKIHTPDWLIRVARFYWSDLSKDVMGKSLSQDLIEFSLNQDQYSRMLGRSKSSQA